MPRADFIHVAPRNLSSDFQLYVDIHHTFLSYHPCSLVPQAVSSGSFSAATTPSVRMMSSDGNNSTGKAGGGAAANDDLIGEPVSDEGGPQQPNTAPEPQKPPPATEKATGVAEEHEFQAETRRLLDIVASSLYSDKEVSRIPQLSTFQRSYFARYDFLSFPSFF